MRFKRTSFQALNGLVGLGLYQESNKVLSMQARLQAGDMEKAKLPLPSLIKLCEQGGKLAP